MEYAVGALERGAGWAEEGTGWVEASTAIPALSAVFGGVAEPRLFSVAFQLLMAIVSG